MTLKAVSAPTRDVSRVSRVSCGVSCGNGRAWRHAHPHMTPKVPGNNGTPGGVVGTPDRRVQSFPRHDAALPPS